MARLFFIQPHNIQDTFITFSPEDERHLISLRMNSGDTCICILQQETSVEQFHVKLIRKKNSFIGSILSKDLIPLIYTTKVHLIQCIPKLDKMDYIIQKASELHTFEIIPVFSRNTDIQNHVGEKKFERWQRIAKESAMQSGRIDIMHIIEPQELLTYVKTIHSPSSLSFLLNEKEVAKSFHHYENKIPQYKDIFLLVGAEGGFRDEEISMLQESYHFESISIGKHILRTETAPIAAISILQYILQEI